MTQKSKARLERDARKKELNQFFKENTIYDDLHSIYNSLINSLGQFGMISQMAKDKELVALLDDEKEVSDLIKILASDTQKLVEAIKDLYALHKDYTGGIRESDTPSPIDLYTEAMGWFERYLAQSNYLDTIIMPTATTIYEEFSKAEKKLNSQQKELASQLTGDEVIDLIEKTKIQLGGQSIDNQAHTTNEATQVNV